MTHFKIALCQITPGYDLGANVQRAVSMIAESALRGASLISLPEMFYHPYELSVLKDASEKWESTLDQLKNAAVKAGVFLCTGTMVYKGIGNLLNRSCLISPSGEELLSYDKCHLFDVNFKGLHVKESDVFAPGDHMAVVNTELGCIGINICYDIRFPEMARHAALCGAELMLVPAVFNKITGPVHWHITMRARAVENQLFLAAISQGENRSSSYRSYGHSMVVSPWGEILGEAGENEEILIVDLKPEALEETRNRLPLLRHRREELYKGLQHCTEQ